MTYTIEKDDSFWAVSFGGKAVAGFGTEAEAQDYVRMKTHGDTFAALLNEMKEQREALIGIQQDVKGLATCLQLWIEHATGAPAHGVTCNKVEHGPEGGYLHDEADDRPYDVDGQMHCGRCHEAIAWPA